MTTPSNFFQHNFVYLVGGILTFLVLSSKNILIYNEELLIALSFFGFVVFSSHTLSQTIQEAFETRRDAIQTELQTYFTLKEHLLLELIQTHTTKLALAEQLQTLGKMSVEEIAVLHRHREQALHTTVASQIQQKLKTLHHREKALQETLQTLCIQGFRTAVLEQFQRGKKQFGPKLIQQALVSLRRTKK